MKYTFSTCIFLIFNQLMAQSPGPRDHLGLAYDSRRNKIVLHAGNDINDEGKYIWRPSTWEWDQSGWQMVDSGAPGPISSMSFVYDPSAKTCVSIGGFHQNKGDVDEVWMWDGASWNLFDAEVPTIRMSATMTFDHVHQQMIVFSGCVGNTYPSDTWVFADNNWQKIADKGPPGICRGAMFYDEVRQKPVVFGGSFSGGDRTNAMYEWTNNHWISVDQGRSVPVARSNITIVYDSHRKRAVLYGGASEEGVLEDLWEWDGKQWEKIEKSGDWPGPREVYGLVYHGQLKEVFLYGGRTGFARPKGDFWSWDGEVWTKIGD